MSQNKRVEPTLAFTERWIRVTDLIPHPRLQRTFKMRRALEIAEDFDPDKFGEIWTVPGENKDKAKYYIFSGQHRVYAVNKLFGNEQKVPCRVYHGLTDAQIANLFLAIDDQMALSTVDRYLMRVTKGDTTAKAVAAILEHHGLKVDPRPGVGTVQAVSALERVFSRGGGAMALTRTVDILQQAWSGTENSYHRDLIMGLGLIELRNGATIEPEALLKTLRVWGGPMELQAAGRDYVSAVGGSVGRGVAEVIVKKYNKTHRKQPLTLEGSPVIPDRALRQHRASLERGDASNGGSGPRGRVSRRTGS